MSDDAREVVIGVAGVRIPRSEIRIRFVRSGGPGGQNVNKLATKAVLRFSVAESEALSDAQRERVRARLGGRVSARGFLRLTGQRFRTQARNEADVIERFRSMLRDALVVRKRRIPTSPTSASRQRRIEDKRRRSRAKGLRRPPSCED